MERKGRMEEEEEIGGGGCCLYLLLREASTFPYLYTPREKWLFEYNYTRFSHVGYQSKIRFLRLVIVESLIQGFFEARLIFKFLDWKVSKFVANLLLFLFFFFFFRIEGGRRWRGEDGFGNRQPNFSIEFGRAVDYLIGEESKERRRLSSIHRSESRTRKGAMTFEKGHRTRSVCQA